MTGVLPSGEAIAAAIQPTARSRRIGGAHVLLAGAVNVLAGGTVGFTSATGRLHRLLLSSLDRYVSEYALVQRGPDIAWLAGDVAIVVAVGLLAAGVAQLVVGWRTVTTPAGPFERSRGVLAAGAGAVNPLATPLALIGLTLCYVASVGADGEARTDADSEVGS
jgi:hypothetical protein